jgi:hypothetical protein
MTASTAAAMKVLQVADEGVTQALLLGIGGHPRDLRSPGWYGIIILDEKDSGYYKAYVGQSGNIGHRLQQHIEVSREDPESSSHHQLLYHIWRKPGRKAVFVHLGTFKGYRKGSEVDELTMNIGEQLLAETFETLQVDTLRRILPVTRQLIQPGIGLNVALPISQGARSVPLSKEDAASAQREFTTLGMSTDWEIVQYYNTHHHQFTSQQQEMGRQSMAETHHIQQIHGARQSAQNKTSALQRGPVCVEEQQVMVFCMKCMYIHALITLGTLTDSVPTFRQVRGV